MKNFLLNHFRPMEAQKFGTIKLGNDKFIVKYLDIGLFSNGDIIPEAKTNEDWEQAGINCSPAWCYFKNDNTINHGKLYNWYAVNDPRGICPPKHHIISSDHWDEFIRSKKIVLNQRSKKIKLSLYSFFPWKQKIQIFPNGYRNPNGKFSMIGTITTYWSSKSYDTKNSYSCFAYHTENTIAYVPYSKNAGFSVICMRAI